MRLVAALCLCLCLAVLATACGNDAPIAHITPAVPVQSVPAPPPTRAAVPIECSPPSPEPADAPRGSHLVVSGACSFTETSRVACSTQPDDFLFEFTRDTPDGPTISFELNVEFYKGPGHYAQNVNVLFEIPDNGSFYLWNGSGSATVDPRQRSGSLDEVTLPAAPGTPAQGAVTVSGTFACA